MPRLDEKLEETLLEFFQGGGKMKAADVVKALSEGLGAEFVPNSVGYKVAFVEGKSRCGSGSGTMKVYGWAPNGKLERSAMKDLAVWIADLFGLRDRLNKWDWAWWRWIRERDWPLT